MDVKEIIVVGDMGTLKTSMIRKFVEGNSSEFYKITIGVDFANKVVQYNDTTTVDVQIWVIAGQESFGNMTVLYYRESIGAIVVSYLTSSYIKEISDCVKTQKCNCHWLLVVFDGQ